MPSGYTYHAKTYKAPPGPKPADIGYEYSEIENERHLDSWHHAVRDLLMQTKAQGVILPQDINLITDMSDTVFKNTYDYSLREGLRAFGHTLSENGTDVFYTAYDPASDIAGRPTTGPQYNGDAADTDQIYKDFTDNEKPMKLVIGVMEGFELSTQASGTYDLPMDGYVPGAYVEGYKNPLHQAPTEACPVWNCNVNN